MKVCLIYPECSKMDKYTGMTGNGFIWNPSLSRDDTGLYELHITVTISVFNFVKFRLLMKRKVLKWEAFVLGLVMRGSSQCLLWLANLRHTQIWWLHRLERMHANCRFGDKCFRLKQKHWYLTDPHRLALCEHGWWLSLLFLVVSHA